MAPKNRPARTTRSLLAVALTAAAIATPTLATSTAAATPTPSSSADPSCAPALITDALTALTGALNPNQTPTDASGPTSMVDLATTLGHFTIESAVEVWVSLGRVIVVLAGIILVASQ